MTSIALALKSEITRLARRHLRGDIDALRKSNSRYRSEIAALKRRMADLEKTVAAMGKVMAKPAGPAVAPEPASSEKVTRRFSAANLKKMRDRFQVSVTVLAKILDVSVQTVYNWEQGTSRPRQEQLEKLALLGKMSPVEFRRRLSEWEGTLPVAQPISR